MIDAVECETYAEPFVGMGGVFLRRTRRPRAEAINDMSGDVATLFRVLQEHYPYFIDMLRWRIASRAEFERLLALPPERLTDLQRAARFLYVQRLAFGGKVMGRTYGTSPRQSARFDVTKLEPMLADVHERLASVTIERLSYADFIRRYDHPGALFFIDPPYWQSEGDYGADMFSRADFQRLADQLAGLQGRFILTVNDVPELREIFGAFAIEDVRTTYSVGGGASAKSVGELIVKGSAF